MKTYRIKWAVKETVNGPGQHDDGVRDGDVRQLASGEIDKAGESADDMRAALTAAMEKAFPPHGVGPTYDLDRTYEIEITELPGDAE